MRALFLMLVLLGSATLGVPSVAHAQDLDRLTCERVLFLIGATSIDEIVRLIDSGRPLDGDLLKCLEDREVPSPIVEAVRRRVGVAVGETAGPYLTVNPDVEAWPEVLGEELAARVQLVAPGDTPLVVLFDRRGEGPLLPWWYLELRDRVAASLLLALPGESAAAESPAVLGEDAEELLDAETAPDGEGRLQNMGFRRVLVLTERPEPATEGVDLGLEVRSLLDRTSRSGRVRVVPSTAALEQAERLAFQVTQSPTEPGRSFFARVRPAKDGLDDLELEAWAAGLSLGRLVPMPDGTYLLEGEVPAGVSGPSWPVELVWRTSDGRFGGGRFDLRLDDTEATVRTRSTTDRFRVLKQERRGVVKKPGVIVGLGVTTGWQILPYGVASLMSARPLGAPPAPYERFEASAFGVLPALDVGLDVHAALQLPGARFGGELKIQPTAFDDDAPRDPESTPFGPGVTTRPTFGVRGTGSILFGGRVPRRGYWFGAFAGWQQWYGVSSTEEDAVAVALGHGVLGARFAFDIDVHPSWGIGVDLSSVLLGYRIGASARPDDVFFPPDIRLTIRAYFRPL